jgi:translocation and assembly module TamB
MMKRLLHSTWILLLALALLCGLGAGWLGWTEAGLRWMASMANRRIGPVELEIEGARGTLHAGIHIDRVVVRHRRVLVTAEGVEGNLALLPLLWQTIDVQRASIGRVEVRVLPHTPSGTPWRPHFLPGLLNIKVRQLAVGHAEVYAPSGAGIDGDDIHAVATIGSQEIRVYEGSAQRGIASVTAQGSVQATQAIGMQGNARLQVAPQRGPAWLWNIRFAGDLDRLGTEADQPEPFEASYAGAFTSLREHWAWHGEARLTRLLLSAWGAGDALGGIHGRLQLGADRTGFTARGIVEPPGLGSGPLDVDVRGRYHDRTIELAPAVLLRRASGTRVTANGNVVFGSGRPLVRLRGEWQRMQWPFADAQPLVRSGAGSYTLEGDRPWAVSADGDLQTGPLHGKLRARGSLATDGIRCDDALLAAWGGEFRLSGAAAWHPEVSWQLRGAARGIDLAQVRPGVVGRLQFHVAAGGHGSGEARSLRVAIDELGGNVRGQGASGHGTYTLDHGIWSLQQVQLHLGATRIELDGHAQPRLDLRFDVSADDLGLLSPGAHGRLVARGSIAGSVADPFLRASAEGHGIEIAGIRLETLRASALVDPRGSGALDASLQLRSLRVGEHEFDRLDYEAHGRPDAQQFHMVAAAAPYALDAAGTARLDAGHWRAEVASASFGDNAGFALQLTAPVPLVVALDASDVRLGRACLAGGRTSLCGSLDHDSAHDSVALSAGNLPLQALTAGIANDTRFTGRLSLQATASRRADGPWLATLAAALDEAQAHHLLRGGRSEDFALGAGRVQAGLDGTGLALQVSLDAGTGGSIEGQLHATRTTADWPQWPLEGALKLQTHSLGFIDSYVAQVDRVAGQLAANLAISGNFGAPQFNGELDVSHAEVDAYQVNLALREVNFAARLHDNVLQLEGSANAGADGQGRFDGEIAWRASLPYGHLHLAGENLRIVNVPEARIQASPDVRIALAGRRIDVTGTVTVPYARLLRPDQLANAVRASGDEVIVNAGAAPRGPAFDVFSDLTLKLGDRVTIDTYGLAGRLSGSLRTVTDESGFNHGTGELEVEEGKYTAYGRKLDIERGRLLFSGGPLGDPGIDLRAVKKFPDITAGVNVRGTLRSPRMTFFADPPVSQSQIVSLLLAGGSLESLQNSTDPTQRSSAARNNMLLQGSAMLFQQFGDRVGLDDVSVESTLKNDTSLVLGRYLSPRLYVSYGISLIEAINTIKVRYTIGDHWTVKTEAGSARSADLVYTIER